jgi:hypothetical protein
MRDADYWVGSLSMTVALAATDPNPKPLLRSALREFLADRPADSELARMLRATLREAKP